jgi:proteasome lid subunit RPN8/RPN11
MYVREGVLDAIVAHARREAPRECCGLLIGNAVEIFEAVAVSNVAAEPLRRYEVSPREHFEQVRRCRALGRSEAAAVDVVGAYHSHPRSAPEPSEMDVLLACEEFLYLIAGPIDAAAAAEIRAFRFRRSTFERLALVVLDGAQRSSTSNRRELR